MERLTTDERGLGLPAGTVTFLLTDIEGSTGLWEGAAEAMPVAVARHYEILVEAISAHAGVRPVEQGEGDSVVAAFRRAGDAVRAALAAQRALVAERWPGGIELRVRMALHTGDAQLRDEGNYFGAAVNRCARLRELARGGQVLLSRATHDLVAEGLLEAVDFVDLGPRRLRGLGRPEHAWGLAHPDLPAGFEPRLTGEGPPNNLPAELSSFVGRERELVEIGRALRSTTLLTLTGAGGCGKSRLALRTAANLLGRFPDGAWWVELGSLGDPDLLGEALARAVGVRPSAGRIPTEAALAQLAAKRALVVLDNCEHLLDPCAELADLLLRGCPDVSLLVTSRESLGLPGETSWRVPSLSLPAGDAPERMAALARSDAVRLFVERARQVRPAFSLNEANAAALAEVCQDLDGIPLAIELAAARIRVMSADEIATGLADRFRLLTGGARTALPRQQTLRASVDWSHRLLDEPEARLLRRLGVFASGFTLDAAESVCAGEGLPREAILDLLASLVDKSLVLAEERGAPTRYRLLETVRHYALEHLVAAGEIRPLRDRHCDAFLALAERVEPDLIGHRGPTTLQLLDADAANLHAAIEWSVETDPDKALRLCAALATWWRLRGSYAAGGSALGRALGAAAVEISRPRGRALWGQASLAVATGDVRLAQASASEALAVGEQLGDQWIQGRALRWLALLQLFPDPGGSIATAERVRDCARAAGDEWVAACAAQVIAWAHSFRDNSEAALRELEAVRETVERLGNHELITSSWIVRGFLLHSSSADERRRAPLQRGMAIAAEIGEPLNEGLALAQLAYLEVQVGKPDKALELLERGHQRLMAASGGAVIGCTVEAFTGLAQASLARLEEAHATLSSVIRRGADGFTYVLSLALTWLASVERLLGQHGAAQAHAQRALEVGGDLGSSLLAALASHELGRLAAARGEWATAERRVHDALAPLVQGRHSLHLPDSLDAVAEIASGLDSHQESVRLLAAAERARTQLGIVRWLPERERFDALDRELRAALGEGTYETARSEGHALSLDDAAAYVRRARGPRKRPAGGWESLTPTELEVARRAAAGLTNSEIGARMFISPATVKVHLSHIYAKLSIRNRAQLSAHVTSRATVSAPPPSQPAPDLEHGIEPRGSASID